MPCLVTGLRPVLPARTLLEVAMPPRKSQVQESDAVDAAADSAPAAGEAHGSDLYWRLRKDVLDGRFPTGTSLLETALSATYGASRTPVREALNLLEHGGLLERAARG
ncbi:GntR family transcriptional regulator [Streptomyces scopuliridis]|uniref:GntR family transcriptional regulator n=1 Tax=Streptomyces scopuliridis TaxID=452529 RepID=UPI0036743AF3